MVPVSGEIKEESSNFEPVNFVSDNEVKDGTDDILPKLSYKYSIDTIRQVNYIIDHNIVIGKISLLTHGDYVEVIRDQFNAQDAHFDQEQEIFLVSLSEVRYSDIMTYDAINKVLYMQLQR